MFKGWFAKPKKKFSLENLKFLHQQLVRNPVVTESNKDQVVEILRTIAELMIWGDQHNENFFDFFGEKGILSYFLKILTQKCDKRVKIQVIQTLSILVQNTSNETSVFYLLSNNYVNDLIVHRFDFSDEELLAYYISFLKTLSLKLNERTIMFFFNERANDFPLYTEAIKFFNHPESMVRVAVRTLSLNVYKVDYPPLRRFILDRSAVPYFSNLVWFLRDEVLGLNQLVKTTTYADRGKLEETIESLIDLFYYLQDILNLEIEALSETLIDQLLSHFVLPVLIGSLYDNERDDKLVTRRLALFLLAQVFLVFSHYPFINSVATSLIDPHPPVLAAQLITSPPQYAVKSPFPITSVLYPKSSPTGAPPSPSYDTPPPKRTRTMTAEEEKKERERKRSDLPEDLNLKARSEVPDEYPVSSPVQACPNYKDLASENVYRGALLGMIFTPADDERMVFGAAAVLLTLLQNKKTDPDLLARAELCPQHYSRSLRLLSELTSPLGDIAENSTAPIRTSISAESDDSAQLTRNPLLLKRQERQKKKQGSTPHSTDDLVSLSLTVSDSIDNAINVSLNVREPKRDRPEEKINLISLLLDTGDASGPNSAKSAAAAQGTDSDSGQVTPEVHMDESKTSHPRVWLKELTASAPATPVGPSKRRSSASVSTDISNAADFGGGSSFVSTHGSPLLIGMNDPYADTATYGTVTPERKHVDRETMSTLSPLSEGTDTQAHVQVDSEHVDVADLVPAVAPSSAPEREYRDRSQTDPLLSLQVKDLPHSLVRPTSPDVDPAGSSDTSAVGPSDSPPHTNRRSSEYTDKHVRFEMNHDSSVGSPKLRAMTLPSSSPKDALCIQKLEYSTTMVSALLYCLQRQPPFRLCTTQLLVDLLLELVYDTAPGPCINSSHIDVSDEALRRAGVDLRNRCVGSLSSLVLDMFEDEWQALKRTPAVRDMISNAMSMLPIADHPQSNIPMAYRNPHGDVETVRKSIQVYLVIRKLRFQLVKDEDRLFPFRKDDSEPQKGADIDIGTDSVIPFRVAMGKKKLNLLLVIHPTYFLVVEKLSASTTTGTSTSNIAKVQMVTPLRHQEAFVDRSNACVLHVTFRSGAKPHPSCVLMKGGPSEAGAVVLRTLWSFTLYFADRQQCIAAKKHLDQSRASLRQALMSEIIALLPLPTIPTSPRNLTLGPPPVPPRTYRRSSASPSSTPTTPVTSSSPAAVSPSDVVPFVLLSDTAPMLLSDAIPRPADSNTSLPSSTNIIASDSVPLEVASSATTEVELPQSTVVSSASASSSSSYHPPPPVPALHDDAVSSTSMDSGDHAIEHVDHHSVPQDTDTLSPSVADNPEPELMSSPSDT